MTDHHQIFLSYSRNDPKAANSLRIQLEQEGHSVFFDSESIRESERWVERLQQALQSCAAFVVLVGHDGVRRWMGAETQTALIRHFDPQDDADRLPIFPVLLGDEGPQQLPAFLRQFQAVSWDGVSPAPQRLLSQIREGRAREQDTKPFFEGNPFVGLKAFSKEQTQLFFGRKRQTLDALSCFDTRSGGSCVRWLEINGNSGSGKSSLMNAGLLPLVELDWLYLRTGYEHWRPIGPMMPGRSPVSMLAETLVSVFGGEMSDVRERLERGDRALSEWLRSRKKKDSAFLLAIDQFEELFTFSKPAERDRFDRLLAHALEDDDCPLFVISTVRADFLDCFSDLPRLVTVRNRFGKAWTLPPIGEEGLSEVIDGPARLAGLDVSEVKEAMLAEARNEPGSLPLVENALHWLWEECKGGALSGRLYNEHGGLVGILRNSADSLLERLGKDQSETAMELLFRLVNVDPDGKRHARRAMSLKEAITVAGGDKKGRDLVCRLAGERDPDSGLIEGPLRLITVTEEAKEGKTRDEDRWVNLIHETLVRSKGPDERGELQPFWPKLWIYIEEHKDRAARIERLHLMAQEWKERSPPARVLGLAGWWSLMSLRGIALPHTAEKRYLRWSAVVVSVQAFLLIVASGLSSAGFYWKSKYKQPLEAVPTFFLYKFGWPVPFPELIKIPAGSFNMGSEFGPRPAQPTHDVTLKNPFYLGSKEVTFDQYDAFCRATGRGFAEDKENWGRSDRPVVNVSWSDAQAYAHWVSAMTGSVCRLPTEAEWEYAARAGAHTGYALPAPAGSVDIRSKGLANCLDCGSVWDGKKTAPVGSFESNHWGLHDMHGNVWEWTEDCQHSDYDGAPTDGRAWIEEEESGGDCYFRSLRGGTWAVRSEYASSSNRYWSDANARTGNIGFRLLCSSHIGDQ